jgi:hypothetical protein
MRGGQGEMLNDDKRRDGLLMLRTESSIEGNGENINLGGWHHR